MIGYYYLHAETQNLIFTKFEPEADSDVEKVQRIDTTDRVTAWTTALEGLALDAKISRVKELANKWNLTFDDSVELLKRVEDPSALMRDGISLFAKEILDMTVDEYWKKEEKAW